MNEIDDRLRRFCERRGVRGVVLRRRSNCAWVTGGADFHVDTSSNLGIAACVWEPGRKMVYTDTIEAPRLEAEEPLDGWEIRSTPWWEPRAELDELLASGAHATDFPDDPLYELRASLTEAQAEQARVLGRDVAAVVGRVLREDVRPGMTEAHLGGAIAGWLRDRGILATVVLVASDERIRRFRHPIPTPRPIERTAMAAVCAQRHGLVVSVTRLVHFGPLADDLARRHDAVCAVDRAYHDASRVGVRWCDVLDAGIEAYERAGFAGEWQRHHQGGPMGYEARDFVATPDERRAVMPDQLIGWNPTVTGTKSEDTILTAASGVAEVVTPDPAWPVHASGRPDILVREP